MKRLLIIPIILMAASCKRESLTTYNTRDNLYFNYALPPLFIQYADTLDLSFAYSDNSIKDTIFNLPVAVTGSPSNTDRRFSVVADPASTAVAGTHYEMPELVIHAGKVIDTLRLRLKRTPDLSSGTKRIILQLQPNEFFNTDLKYRTVGSAVIDSIDMLKFSINVSDMLSAGPYWERDYKPYFGNFSLKKVKFMNDLVGLPFDFWSTASPGNQKRAEAIYYASVTGRYLMEQASEGNTIYDEDGTAMTMGPGFQ